MIVIASNYAHSQVNKIITKNTPNSHNIHIKIQIFDMKRINHYFKTNKSEENILVTYSTKKNKTLENDEQIQIDDNKHSINNK
jgi:hypothetical protein